MKTKESWDAFAVSAFASSRTLVEIAFVRQQRGLPIRGERGTRSLLIRDNWLLRRGLKSSWVTNAAPHFEIALRLGATPINIASIALVPFNPLLQLSDYLTLSWYLGQSVRLLQKPDVITLFR